METADIVRSLTGRDAGGLFYIVGFEGTFALLSDGKGRRADKPKKKNPRHIKLVSADDSRTAQKIKNGEKVTNIEIRRALATFAGNEEVCKLG